MIRAVIFDMDGVLIDAREWHYEALNQALAHHGYTISREDHLTTYDGLPTSCKLDILSATCGLPRELHDIINRQKQVYSTQLIEQRTEQNPAHIHALSELKKRGYKLAVASNSVRRTVDMVMEHTGLASFIDFALSSDDVSNPKPNPEIYELAFQRLHLQPSQCLVIEDNNYGVQAALSAGAPVLRVQNVDDVILDNILHRIESANKLSA